MGQTALTLVCATIVGALFTRRYPFPEHEFLAQLTLHANPWLYRFFHWSWAAMLFTTPALGFACSP